MTNEPSLYLSLRGLSRGDTILQEPHLCDFRVRCRTGNVEFSSNHPESYTHPEVHKCLTQPEAIQQLEDLQFDLSDPDLGESLAMALKSWLYYMVENLEFSSEGFSKCLLTELDNLHKVTL